LIDINLVDQEDMNGLISLKRIEGHLLYSFIFIFYQFMDDIPITASLAFQLLHLFVVIQQQN
jgi:hypothetical protein